MSAPKGSDKPHLIYWGGKWHMLNWYNSTIADYEAAYQWMQRINAAASVLHTPCTTSRL